MPEVVTIETGVSEDSQMGSFENATLQGTDEIAISIAAYCRVPDSVYAQGQKAVAEHIRRCLEAAVATSEGLSFHVQIGPAEGAQNQDEDDTE